MEEQTKIAELIKNSRALSEDKKELYLQSVSFFSQETLKNLQTLLEHEQETLSAIHAEDLIEREKINQAAALRIDQTFKKALTFAMADQEAGEKEGAEDLLQKLDQL